MGLLVLSYIRFGVSVVVPIVGLVGLLVPGFYLRFRTGRRLKQMNNQLVDVLGLMGNSLKAGHSLPQTLELISRDARAPSGRMKPGKKFTITTPPFWATSFRTSSGTLRG